MIFLLLACGHRGPLLARRYPGRHPARQWGYREAVAEDQKLEMAVF